MVETSEKAIVDFPFDLNNLFNMQYSFDQLKAAIEFLAKQSGDHTVLINELLAREPGTITIIEKTETIIKPTVSSSNKDKSKSSSKPVSAVSTKKDSSPTVVSAKKDSIPIADDTKIIDTKDNDASYAAEVEGLPAGSLSKPVESLIKSIDSKESMTDLMSPLQKQATQTQRMLGGLDEELEKAKEFLKEHEKRIIKLENKAA